MNIPKKLNNWTKTKKIGEDYLVLWESVVEIKQKQDEIISYLQAKEEASKGECMPLKLKPEDVAGEYDYKVDIKNSLPIPKEEKCDCPRCNPPEHEEECLVHAPPEQEESPKEDEQDWTRDFYETVSRLSISILTSDKRIIEKYIKTNFVSKEKIKRYCDEQIEAYDIASDYDSGVRNTLNRLKESLGLGY